MSDSMGRWSNLGSFRLPNAAIPGLPEGYGGSDDERVRWIEGHFKFCRQVFAGADDFMEYDVEDPEAPQKIAAFLGIDLPWWGVANANTRHEARSRTVKLWLVITPEALGAPRLQEVLDDQARGLAKQGVVYSRRSARRTTPGSTWRPPIPAMSIPCAPARGYAAAHAQACWRHSVAQELKAEVERARQPDPSSCLCRSWPPR